LAAHAQGGQETKRAHVVDEVGTRPCDRIQGKAGAFEPDQVQQIVAPCRRPQRRSHLSCVELLGEPGILAGSKGRVRERGIESERPSPQVGIAAARCLGSTAFGGEAARVQRIVRGPAGCGFGAVVRWRACAQEAEADGVVMGVEQ
jgi:hypothetical protein